MTIRFKLSPSLFDGENHLIIDTKKLVAEAVDAWVRGGPQDGDECTVEAVDMTDEDFDKLIRS